MAYYLPKSGVRVGLVEKEAIGSGSSAHATGSLSLLETEFSPGRSVQSALESFNEFTRLAGE